MLSIAIAFWQLTQALPARERKDAQHRDHVLAIDTALPARERRGAGSPRDREVPCLGVSPLCLRCWRPGGAFCRRVSVIVD